MGISTGKATDAEIKRRVGQVHKLIVAGASRGAIVQHGSKTWNITERAVDDYIARAKAILVEQVDRDLDGNLAIALERMNDLYQRCLTANNIKGAIQAQQEISKLLGLYAPTRQDVAINAVMSVKSYKNFTPDEWDNDPDTTEDR